MSLNTAHLNGGVLIHNGEQILLYSDAVGVEWNGQQISSFQGVKKGSIYLTTHRVIFLNKSSGDEMLSFSFPFITLSEVDIEQPVFGANYIKGKVRAQPNGNWIGEAKFKITFKHGGAIEFGQAMLRAAHLASRGGMQAPPPYVPPQTQWYAAPPPAYAPPPQGYYGWSPPTNVFPQQPPSDGVFMTDAPPPYPGIIPGYQANGYGPPQGPPSPAAAGYGAYPQGYAQGGPPAYPGAPGGSAGYAPQGAGGFQQPQFTNAAGAMVLYRGGAPNVNTIARPYQIRGQPHQYRAQPFQYGSYQRPQARNNPHWSFPPRRQDAKAHEAAQSAYYDPNRPQMAYVPPPAYYENPPTYNQATNKKQQ